MIFASAVAILAIVAGFAYRRRFHMLRRGEGVGLNDDMIERIESTGRLEVEEPLDLDEAREEEQRFWKESTWDEPDEY